MVIDIRLGVIHMPRGVIGDDLIYHCVQIIQDSLEQDTPV